MRMRVWNQVGMDSRRRRVMHTDIAVWLSSRVSMRHGTQPSTGVGREEGEKNYYEKRRLDIYNGGIRAQEMAIKVACEIGSFLRHEFQKRWISRWRLFCFSACPVAIRPLVYRQADLLSLLLQESIRHPPPLRSATSDRLQNLSSCVSWQCWHWDFQCMPMWSQIAEALYWDFWHAWQHLVAARFEISDVFGLPPALGKNQIHRRPHRLTSYFWVNLVLSGTSWSSQDKSFPTSTRSNRGWVQFNCNRTAPSLYYSRKAPAHPSVQPGLSLWLLTSHLCLLRLVRLLIRQCDIFTCDLPHQCITPSAPLCTNGALINNHETG